MRHYIQLALIAACMLGAAFYSGIETGVISINRMRLRHFVRKRTRGARILMGFLQHPDRLLGTTLVGTNICIVMCSVAAASLAGNLWGVWGKAASSILMTILLLVFSEFLPKVWFQSRPIWRCLPFASFLKASEIVLRPAASLITGFAKLITPRSKRKINVKYPLITREELKVIATEEEQHGVLSAEERRMIHKIFDFPERMIGNIMVPRSKMTVVDSTMTMEEVKEKSRTSGCSRFPVFDKEEENFTGILDIDDVLALPADADKPGWIGNCAQPPQWIEETASVAEITSRIRLSRQLMFLVTGGREFGVVGLVTVGDVFKEILGRL